MTRAECKVGDTIYVRPGCGFWDITSYPIGGCFDRAGHESVPVKVEGFYKTPIRGCDIYGTVETGGSPEKVAVDTLECDATPVEPEPEPEQKPEEHFCHYSIFNRDTGEMELCGAPALNTSPADLCEEHFAFVKDCTVGPFTKSKKAHPAGYDWLSKARAAYGVARPSMKPSDAGKPAHNPCTPAESAAWALRMPMYDNVTGEPVRTAEMIEARYQEIIAAEAPAVAPCPVVSAPEPIPEPVAVDVEVKKPEPIREYTREVIEAACRRIMESKEQYKGTGINPIIWSIGFRVVYKGQPASEKQLQAVRAIVAKQANRYVPLFAAA